MNYIDNIFNNFDSKLYSVAASEQINVTFSTIL